MKTILITPFAFGAFGTFSNALSGEIILDLIGKIQEMGNCIEPELSENIENLMDLLGVLVAATEQKDFAAIQSILQQFAEEDRELRAKTQNVAFQEAITEILGLSSEIGPKFQDETVTLTDVYKLLGDSYYILDGAVATCY